MLTIESGDTVDGAMRLRPRRRDAAAGFRPDDPAGARRHLAANPGVRAGHIVTGPIAIAGAEPGDMLEIRIDRIEPGADWGYNVIRPLAGTLPEDFHETACSATSRSIARAASARCPGARNWRWRRSSA